MHIILMTRYALAVLLTFTALSANADTVRYAYNGADISTYTATVTWYPGNGPEAANVPNYFHMMTGWVELDGPLAANLSNADISGTLSSWEFHWLNGSTLMNSQTSQSIIDDFGACYTACLNLTVSTDAQGNISEWSFSVSEFTMSEFYKTVSSRFSLTPSVPNGERATDRSSIWLGGGFTQELDYRSASVGSWSTTVVPIPGAVWLFASALGLMGWRSRRC